jgi:hypothetical protein
MRLFDELETVRSSRVFSGLSKGPSSGSDKRTHLCDSLLHRTSISRKVGLAEKDYANDNLGLIGPMIHFGNSSEAVRARCLGVMKSFFST